MTAIVRIVPCSLVVSCALVVAAAPAAADPNRGSGTTSVSGGASVQGGGGSFNAPPPVSSPTPMMGPTPVAPQPTYQAPPPVVTQQQIAQARAGLFGSLHGGALIPVEGDYGNVTSVGGVAIASGGWELQGGLSFRLEVGFRYNPYSVIYSMPMGGATTSGGSGLGAVFYGAGLRFTPLREFAFHPFVEAFADGFNVLSSSTSGGTTTVTSNAVGFSFGGAAGLELDLNEQFSLEGAVRYDQAFGSSTSGLVSGGLVNVLVGGSFYY